MRITRRTGPVVVGGVVLALTLGGCTASDDISARLENGTVVFVTCQDQEFNSLRVLTAEKDVKPVKVVEQWVATGDIDTAHSGSEFDYGVTPAGTINKLEPESLQLKGQVVEFFLEVIRNDRSETGAFAQFDGDLLESDKWLNSIRGLTDTACE
jgi:hypothetical protein